MPTSLRCFLYARHFRLLACCSALVAAMSLLRLPSNIFASFALYGALHASALIFALRVPQPLGRRSLFIVMAAALSAMTPRVGLFTGQVFGAVPGNMAFYAALGLSAGMGAVAYGILIRWLGIYRLDLSGLAVISMGCVLSTCLAYVTMAHGRWLGPWWLAVLWWHAFSGGLWYLDSCGRGRTDASPKAADV